MKPLDPDPDSESGSGSRRPPESGSETLVFRVAGAGVFGWSRNRNFHPAPASTNTVEIFTNISPKYLLFMYFKLLVFSKHKKHILNLKADR